MSKGKGQSSLDVGAAAEKTALGFGGKTIPRQLEVGDSFYVLMHCEVSKTTLTETDEGDAYSAGARTDILCELPEKEAIEIARAHGWIPKEEEPDNVVDLKTTE